MNLLRQQILSCSALAKNQNRGIRRRHAVRHFERAPHFRRTPDHLPKLPFGRQLPPQRIIFFFQRRQLQKISHPLPQFLQFESFYQIIRRPKLQRFHRRLGRVQRRNHQHRNLASLFAHPPQKRQSILTRLLPWQRLGGRFRRIRLRDSIFRFQRPPQPVSCRRLVVYDQNGLHLVFLTSLLHYFFVPSTGSVTRNRVPWPSRSGLSQFIFPPNSATRRATMAKPSPV